ncbi:MAG: energy-coupled thiamine transporter ThiT [Ruminococcus sp.]|nr:energy-coupled thiamine transporter ThiT [Ruminococcus sp.]
MASEKKKFSVLMLVEGAVMIALAVVLSFVRPVKLQWGGSITLLSMLPICIYSIRHGVGAGLCVSFLYSLFQFGQGVTDGLFGWGLTTPMLIACILFDYILAYTSIGFAGIFRKLGDGGKIVGIVLALLLRFFFHFLSGVVVWKSMGQLWESDLFINNSALYSLVYNGAYMLPEIILTTIFAVILMKNGVTKKFFAAK